METKVTQIEFWKTQRSFCVKIDLMVIYSIITMGLKYILLFDLKKKSKPKKTKKSDFRNLQVCMFVPST